MIQKLALAFCLLFAVPVAAQTPSGLQSQVDAIQWPGFKTVTGQGLQGLFNYQRSIFTNMGTWDASGNFQAVDSAKILGQTPVAVAFSGSGSDITLPALANADSNLAVRLGAMGSWDSLGFHAANALDVASAPFLPVLHPSSDNYQGSGGFNAQGVAKHALVWTDQNYTTTADVINWQSNDPSSLNLMPITGTYDANDVVSVTFNFTKGGAAKSYTITAATGLGSLQGIATDLAAKIKTAGSDLFVPPNGGAGGAVVGVSIAGCGAQLCLDINSGFTPYSITTQVTNSVAQTSSTNGVGTASTVIAPANGCATVCSMPLDNNPVLITARNPSGVVPAANSQIFSLKNLAFDSTGAYQKYVVQAAYVTSSTSGALGGKYSILTTNPTVGGFRGISIGPGGVYTSNCVDPGLNQLCSGPTVVQDVATGTYKFTVIPQASGAFLSAGTGLPFVMRSNANVEFARGNTDGSMTLSGQLKQKTYPFASLPTGVEGATTYCTNCRKVTETAGNGTGIPVYYSSATWRRYSDDTAAAN